VRFGDLRGRFGAPHLIARSAQPIDEVRLAVNSRGVALLAWSTSRDYVHGTVDASMRHPGGGFGRAIRLNSGAVRSLTTAVGPSGDTLVAWNELGVRARFKRRSVRSNASGPSQAPRRRPQSWPMPAHGSGGSR
jgi:hypothetical protein